MSEVWKRLYKKKDSASFKEIIELFFGTDADNSKILSAALRINTNDIFFKRNTEGDYILRDLQEVAMRLNKTPEQIEKEIELYEIPPGTVLKLKPLDALSKDPFEYTIFTGQVNAKGIYCITKEGTKTFWFSKYIGRTDKVIAIENRTEEDIIEELKK